MKIFFTKARCVLLLAASFQALSLFAQGQTTISGTVTDESKQVVPGISVTVKGTTTGGITNGSGNYSFQLPAGASVLVFSGVGFARKEVNIDGQTHINVILSGTQQNINEVVVVGYGTQKKITVTGSVATVKGTDLQKSPATNITNSIAGRMPGVIATNASGEPGQDGSTIRIRGTNTLGNNDALIVIDGVPARAGGIDRLNPADIESMSVLKDASAAIYGARAANGVILVTTKHGKLGKPEISYNFNTGWAQPTVIPKMANATEYATMVNEIDLYGLPSQYWKAGSDAFKATGSFTRPDNGAVTQATYKPDDLKKFTDGSDPWGHPNTDWFKSTLKNWSPQTRQTLQLSGGSENLKYLTSLGYENQDGYYINSATGYKQYDFRINMDAKVNKYVSTTIGVTGRQETRNYPTVLAGDIFRMLIRGYPTRPAYWPNGLPGPDIENGQQPVVIATNQTGYNKDIRYYLQTNAKLEILVPGIKGLKLTGNVAIDKYIKQTKNFQTPWFINSWDNVHYQSDGKTPLLQHVARGPAQATLNQGNEDQLNVMLEGIASYEHNFGAHNLTLLAGVTKETQKDDYFGASRRYFLSTAIDQLNAGGSLEKDNSGSAWQRARLNYFGRVGYNYKEKYIAEFLWRYDGSYMFPQTHRFGFFPGVSAGWRISEEGFFKDNIRFINYLKFRASWGKLGNDQVYYPGTINLDEYAYLATYGYNSYITNGAPAQTLQESVVPNPNFTWEVANNVNLGLDGTIANGKIHFEFDVFQNKRSQILWFKNASIPATSGINNLLPPENIGKVSNRGFEFNIGYDGNIGRDFQFNAGVNGGFSKNRIDFWDETPGAPAYQKSTGHPINSSLYYIYDGIFSTQAQVDANKLDYSGVGESKIRLGDMKYKDVNGDGKIDANDQVRRDKTPQPTFQGGITLGARYQNFDFSLLLQGAAGGEIFLQTESGTIGNYLKYSYDNRWTVDNLSTTFPRTVDRNNQYFSGNNTRWLFSTDYIRLKNVELGYTVPTALLKKVGLGSLRFYVNGLNLHTFTKQKIFDPEAVNSNLQYYPQSRLLNAGLSVKF